MISNRVRSKTGINEDIGDTICKKILGILKIRVNVYPIMSSVYKLSFIED